MFSKKNKKLVIAALAATFISLGLLAGPWIARASAAPSDVTNFAVNFEGDCKDANPNADNCSVVAYLVTFTRVLSGVVGIIIVIMIAVGGIQYAAARDNPQAVVAARGRIINALIALVLYLFSFSILQWLIPGGII